jgi:hypothetical protein
MFGISVGIMDGSLAPVVIGDYDSIQTVTVGSGGSASVTFSSIPSTYKHLQIRVIGKSTAAQSVGDLTFNSDTGSNYTYHSIYGDGSSAASEASTPRANIASVVGLPISSSANVFAASVIDILDYANTNKNKTVRALVAEDRNGAGYFALVSGSWMNTAAITSITITARTASIGQYSSFALYGIKG